MKKILVLALLAVGICSFMGCERNDYQHPMHRANKGG
ncbi:hypothetical protein LMG8286_00296 [Campylobacter suis]|uniref:Lipoprotein n=1 Tax=Campylobacter suis TaxID=2790657 RepID=A0ABM8Q100_9BACT|nr:hypothetical protein LMG8286_00296 [Campylobacter suis]